MNRRQGSISQLQQPKQNQNRRRREAHRDEKNHGESQRRPRVHQMQLQKPDKLANVLIVTSVVLLLPLRPIRRRLVVPLHHLHLVYALPQYYHALLHPSPSSAVIMTPLVRIRWSPLRRRRRHRRIPLPKTLRFALEKTRRTNANMKMKTSCFHFKDAEKCMIFDFGFGFFSSWFFSCFVVYL